jgi:signal transduction histidine kinase
MKKAVRTFKCMRLPPVLKSYRAVLWAGFGGLLAIILLIGWQGSRVISAIEAQNGSLRKAYTDRDELLDGIRFDLAQSGSSVRDYLLDDNRAAVERHRAELRTFRQRIDSSLAAYGRDLPADEAPLWSQLKQDIDAYWRVLEPATRWDAGTRLDRAESFLRRQVIPRQQELEALISSVDQVDQRNLEQSNRKISELFSRFRRELALWTLAAALLGGALAFLAVQQVLNLEHAADRRLREVTQARSELQYLSNRVVTVQEEERRRVARELHDEVGQTLSAVLVELGRATNRLPAECGSRVDLSLAQQLAQRVLGQVRDIALLLRPSMLDDLGLVPALKWQAREVSRRTGIKVRVAADTVADDLPDKCRTCIYRVVQEALNNAARHAQASWARVEAVQENGQIRVTIQDNGAGFDPSQEKGVGILGMEERVKGLGGVFRIHSEKGSGTIVSLLLPMAHATGEVRS